MLAVVFQVHDAHYAIRCQSIVEVIPRVSLRPVPQAPVWLRGVFAYRGNLSPVVDLCQLIAGYACPDRLSSRIVLVRASLADGESLVAGLLAEHMTEARQVRATALPGSASVPGSYWGEMMLEDGSLLQMIDEVAMLRHAGLALNQALEPRLEQTETDRERTQP
jgi:chemotaxis-related protein WspB